MKLKKIFITLGLSLAVGMGFSAGLCAVESEAKETNATTSETTFYINANEPLGNLWAPKGGASINDIGVYLWNNDNDKTYVYHGGSDDNKGGLTQITINDVTYLSFDMSDRNYANFIVYCWDMKNTHNKTGDLSFSSFSAGQNLVTLSHGDSWDNTLCGVTFGTLVVDTTWTINKFGICDGDKANKWVIESDSIEDGDTYPVPSRINLSDYHFGGWFIDEDCTTAYTAQEIEDDLDIYAKYTSFSQDSYIYYVNADTNETNDMFHTWGGDQEYAVNDEYIKTIGQEIHGVITFDGYTRNIYKIPFSSESEDTAFKFHAYNGDNGWGYESSEHSLVSGYAYNWMEGYTLDSAAAGAAIDFLLYEESLRNAVEDWGDNNLDYSICGISPSNAAKLYEKYLGLNSRAAQYVNNSYVKTYNDDPDYAGVSEGNVKLDAIMEEILIIALRDTKFAEDHPTLGVSPIFFDSENSGLIIAVTAFAAILATGGFFFLRRRKEN